MVLVRRIRKRGANIVVEAHGEVLFSQTGDVGRWTNRFSQRVRAFSAQEAPVNKRPRWGHYGKPLKTTLTASTTYQPVRMRVYSAVGSTAPHAYYVDQGTGIYNGSSPWKAKVLPPYADGSPSLYEHTWHPPGQMANHTVLIKGQKGQFFFDKGLKRGFQSMRMRSFQVPGEGASQMSEALKAIPAGLTNFAGNTPADTAFRASLTEWRAWRDEHFNSGRLMGKYGGFSSAEADRRRAAVAASAARRQRRAAFNKARRAILSKQRSQERRDRLKAQKAKSTQKKKAKVQGSPRERQAILEAKKVMAKWLMTHPGGEILGYSKDGFNYELKKGNQTIRKGQPWSAYLVDLFYGVD